MTTIVSIHSFRGGTGKSNVSANVAATLAANGQRVGLIDTDIQSPGIHVLFGIGDDYAGLTLNDYLFGKCEIADAAVDVTDVVRSTAGSVADGGALFLVPSSIRSTEIARVLREGYDVGRLNDGFGQLGRALDLDVLVIDTHPGLNEETLLSITVSDVLILLMRPDKQDFQGTAVTIDVARRLDVPDLVLLANKLPSSVDAIALEADLVKVFDAPVAALLPLSEEVVENASGSLFALAHPDHPWSQGIAKVAARIAG